MDNKTYKKIFRKGIGPGGINCPCCAYGKHKDRTQFYTQVTRKRLNEILVDEIEEAFEELEEEIV